MNGTEVILLCGMSVILADGDLVKCALLRSGVLTSTSRLVLGKMQSVMHSLWARGLNFFNIIGATFALIDFALMVLYLTQYLAAI